MFVKKDRKHTVVTPKPLEIQSIEELQDALIRKRTLYENKALRDALPDKGKHILETIAKIEKLLGDKKTCACPNRKEDLPEKSPATLASQLENMSLKEDSNRSNQLDASAHSPSSSSLWKTDQVAVKQIPNPFQKLKDPSPDVVKKREKASRDRDELIHGKRGLAAREKRNQRTIKVIPVEESIKLYEERKRDEHEQMIREAREQLLKAASSSKTSTTAPPPSIIAGPYRDTKHVESDSEEDDPETQFAEIELPANDDDDDDAEGGNSDRD